ncbi:uncharacterized protein G2W53_032015 [Senna tora]|uniref:Uncharacterized protein n=1 Tax=Senna tora TaxID=362788 RepID=A0A834WBE7_9FABA|nr:uncharacterized protein G2W53_032015 [Senna tora]
MSYIIIITKTLTLKADDAPRRDVAAAQALKTPSEKRGCGYDFREPRSCCIGQNIAARGDEAKLLAMLSIIAIVHSPPQPQAPSSFSRRDSSAMLKDARFQNPKQRSLICTFQKRWRGN